mmetsp:Transcript_214/g.531  ORF Transcript_214/g.531 Transcript_214/m.531 type:complete len:205 (-) Transcript_214:78-692(-)
MLIVLMTNVYIAPVAAIGGSGTAAAGPDPTTARRERVEGILHLVGSAVLGAVLAGGLILAGLTQPSNVVGFLDVTRDAGWNPALAVVAMTVVSITMPAFTLILKRQRPLALPEFDLPKVAVITPELVIGAALFGLSWGLSGVCPSLMVCGLGAGKPGPFLFAATMSMGMVAAELAVPRIKGEWNTCCHTGARQPPAHPPVTVMV